LRCLLAGFGFQGVLPLPDYSCILPLSAGNGSGRKRQEEGMKERRVFRSAAEVAAFCAGEAFGKLVEREVAGSRVVFGLLRLRLSRDLSVETLARRMGCDPEKIRRMEEGRDSELDTGDVEAYLSALGVGADEGSGAPGCP